MLLLSTVQLQYRSCLTDLFLSASGMPVVLTLAVICDTQAKQFRKYRISSGLLRLRIAVTGYHFCKTTAIPKEPIFIDFDY